MSRNDFWEWCERYGWYVAGPILMGIGYLVGKYLEPRWHSQVITEISIALWIAGILTLTVDPFIKSLARREATRDIFHHMMGFGLPFIIRERLDKIVKETKLYREDVILHIDMSEIGDLVEFDVQMEFEVANPTKHSLVFTPTLQFESGEAPGLKRVISFGDSNYDNNPALSPVGNLGALKYEGKNVAIPK